VNEIKLHRITEKTAAQVAQDERISEFGYYPIAGTSVDTINPIKQDYMIRDAYYMWLKNPLANAVIESCLDFTLGDGVQFKANDERVQELLEKFFYDSDNKWDRKGKMRFRDLSLYGELILRTNKSKLTGMLKTHSIHPEQVVEMFRSKKNPEKLVAIRFRDDDKKYEIIQGYENAEDENIYQGDIFYWKINSTIHQTRGLSDLFTSRDWLRMWDKALYSTLERVGLLLSFVWDITIEGGKEKDLRAKLASLKQNPPQPGGARIHNEKEKWNALSPQLQGGDLDTLFRLFKSPMLAQTRTPEDFMGLGGDVNYATALAMNAPFYRKIKARQKDITYIFQDMFDYQIYCAKNANMLAGVEDFGYDVMLPEPDKEIAKGLADTLQKFSVAVTTLASNGYIENIEAKKILQLIIGQMGVEIETSETESQVEESIYNKTSKFVKNLKYGR
jgi:hypothetical protein